MIAMTECWEYEIILGSKEIDVLKHQLNRLGSDGWELVVVLENTYPKSRKKL
jgi:hypothetical protein